MSGARWWAGRADLGRGDGVEFAVGAGEGGLLHVAGRAGPQVVGGLAAQGPGQLVQLVQLAAVRRGHVEVQRLGLVDPFLPAGRRLDQPRAVDLEGGAEQRLDVVGDAVDRRQGTVEVLQVGDHHLVPQPAVLERPDQMGVDDGEVAGHVRLDEQVPVGWLDRLADPDDVRDGRRRRDRHHVGVAHADGDHLLPQRVPVQPGAGVLLEGAEATPVPAEDADRVDRQDSAAPQRPVERRIAPALGGQLGGGRDGPVRKHFHRRVGEVDRGVRGVRQAQGVQGVGEAHQAQPDRPVPQVGPARATGWCTCSRR